jgi:hypothetical protein
MPAWSSGGSQKEAKSITLMHILPAKPGRTLIGLFMLFFCLSQYAWGGTISTVEVRRLGLSKVGENTMLTVVLDRPASPLVTCREVGGIPQVVVDFPRARAGVLPSRLEGDESLVQQVVTEKGEAQGGVRIILDLFPGKPYIYWQKSRPGSAGQTFYFLGLKPDLQTHPAQTQIARPPAPEPAAPTPEAGEEIQEKEALPEPPAPKPQEYGYQAPQGNVAPGSFAELRQLIPQAGNLMQSLQTSGWVVAESHRYDRPGHRFSRDFIITNSRYPELSVKIAYLPSNVPDTPNISIIMLTTDNLQSEEATKYQALRQWTFAQIKKKYEDIGDFFDDALKPLRVKLRQQTQALALRDAAVFTNFLKLACPNNPQVVAKVMNHIKEKVNPRFEGVQWTVNEKPLVFLNLVDFLYLKVYYVGHPH